MSNLISSWVSRLRGRREGPEALPGEVADLQLVRLSEGLVEVRSTRTGEPLFRFRGSVAGPPEEKPEPEGSPRYVVPLRPEGSRKPWLRLQVERAGAEPGDEAPLLVRSRLDRRRDVQTLEFRLDGGAWEVQYRFEADPGLEVSDLAPVQPLPSLFSAVPAPEEMAAFLHRLTHEQPRFPRILASLARSASAAAAARAQALAQARPVPAPPPPLVQARSRVLAARGCRTTADALEAFCTLLDLEQGNDPPPSPGAALAVADLFGVPLDEAVWDSDFAAFGTWEEARRGAEDPARLRLLARLREERRGPLDVLDDLGRDSGSRRVLAATRRLRPRVPGGRVRVNDEQQALLPLLKSSGRPVHPETMVALCLFVDLETGDLTEEQAENLPTNAEAWDTSMYALIAVAGAFGLKLEALALEGEPGAPDPIGTLAERAEGGLLACFRHPGQPGHWWEWIRGEQEFQRAEGDGLDFSGIVLAHFPAGPGEAPLRVLDRDLLHGRGEVLSREALAFRQIQAALRRLGPAGRERVSLRQYPEALEGACDWLRSGGAASMLDPLVHGETRRGLIQALRRDGLDARVERRLVEAAGQPPGLELLGLFLLQEMCASPRLKLEGNFKYYDERALRATLLDRASALLASSDVALRTLAPRLLAAADLAADRATRLGTEYSLGVARGDVDPGVQAEAVEALVRLALVEVVPLVPAVELVPLQPGEEAPLPSTLSAADREAALVELLAWLKHVGRTDAVRLMGLSITDAAGSMDQEKARPLLEILGGIQQASRQDGTLGTVRWLALASLDDLGGCARAVLESWRTLARMEDRPLAALDPVESSLEYRLLVEDQASRLLQRCGGLPHLGGPGRPVTVFRVAPGRPAGPWTQYEKYRGVIVTEEAPFFAELLERARRMDLRRLRVLRLAASRVPVPEGVPERQTARLEGMIELREVEVLDPLRLEFTSLLGWFGRSPADLGLEGEPLEDLRTVLVLAEGQKPEGAPSPAGGPAASVESPPEKEDVLPRAAAALARQFELEGAQERLLRMLRKLLGT